MLKALPLLLLLLSAASDALVAHETTIAGHLLGHDGMPMPKARVYLFRHLSFTPVAASEAASDGSFSIRGDYRGVFRLKFTGANHREFSIPLILENVGNVKLDVRLGVPPPILEYDGQGNPLPPPGEPDSMAVVRYSDPVMQRRNVILLEMEERAQRVDQLMAECRRREEDCSSITFDWSKDRQELATAIAREREQLVRQTLLFSYIMLESKQSATLDSALVERAFREIPPNSLLWQIDPRAVHIAMSRGAAPERYDSYCWRIATQHPDTNVRLTVLHQALGTFLFRGEIDLGRRYFRELVGKYPQSEQARDARRALNPDPNVTGGAPLPQFSVASLDDPAVMISNEDLKGKIYLIDFWGTWCGPCIAEMEYLHAAHEKFGGKNFEILSIALESHVEPVVEFRRRKWKMPWRHAIVTDRDAIDEIKLRFEAPGVPWPILVDASGTILTTRGLRGENLLGTLEKYLAPGDRSKDSR